MDFPIKSLILMMLLAFGMFYGQLQYKKKGVEWGKFLTISCGIAIIICALIANLCTSSNLKEDILREHKYERAQAITLASHLVSGYSGSGKCLVIHYPASKDNMISINRIVAGFKEGFGNAVSEIITIPIVNINPDTESRPDEEWNMFTANDYNTVIRNNKDCDIVIFLLQLPTEDQLYEIDIFKMVEDPLNPGSYKKDPNITYPTVGIFNSVLDNTHELISENLIKALTIWQPSLTYEENPPPAPDNVQEAFNKRFILVTASNLDSLKEKFPNLFPVIETVEEPVQ
jgi:hypothetical protein